jgi:hypothetical protein
LDETPPVAERWWATVEGAAALPIPGGQRSVEVISHGSMVVKYYAPRGRDEQTPHTRDELYVVARGSGTFVGGDRRNPFSASDVLSVPAGGLIASTISHDLGTWVAERGGVDLHWSRHLLLSVPSPAEEAWSVFTRLSQPHYSNLSCV